MTAGDVTGLIRANRELWELYTGAEEYSPGNLDRYGRFPCSSSRRGGALEPRVSRFLVEHGLRVEYPQGRKFAVCLTHDTDIINLKRREHLGRAVREIREGDPRSSAFSLMAAVDKKMTPLGDFERIMSIEEEHGAASTFYFLALEEEDEDYNYGIAGMRDEVRSIRERGWEVGLHGGHTAYDDGKAIAEEKSRLEDVLGSKVVGYRNHYLRFKTPDTWELLSKAGFEYDSTFGWADMAGFRNGMCHPFRPYNLKTGRRIGILEIPLVFMDVTPRAYMNLSARDAWGLLLNLLRVTEKYNGVMTVLWHNDQVSGEMGRLYLKMLKYCMERKAWMAPGKDVCDWWTRHQPSGA